jgi:hypothetical protein
MSQVNRELIRKTAEEMNMPYDQVEMLVNNFWQSLRGYLSRPDNIPVGGIEIRNFIVIKVKKLRLMWELRKIVENRSYATKENQEIMINTYRKLKSHIKCSYKEEIHNLLIQKNLIENEQEV